MSDSSNRPPRRDDRGRDRQAPERDPRRLSLPVRPSSPSSPNEGGRPSSHGGARRDDRRESPRGRDLDQETPRRSRSGSRDERYERDERPRSGPRDWDDTEWRGGGQDDDRADGRRRDNQRPSSAHGDRAGARPATRPGQPQEYRDASPDRRPRRRAGGWDDADEGGRRGWDDEDWRADGWEDHARGSRRPANQRDQRMRRDTSRGGRDDWSPSSRVDVRPSPRGRAQAAWDATGEMLAAVAQPSRLPAWLDRMLPKNQRARGLAIIMLVVIVVCAIGSVPAGYFGYASTMSLAKDGAARLKLAENDFKTLATSPTNLAVINDAQAQFQAAHDDFVQVQWRVAPLTPAQFVPGVGSKVGAAARLVPLAVEGTQAGVIACDAMKILVTGLKNPLGTTGGLTSADLSKVASDLDQIQTLFGQIAGQVGQLQPSDLTLDPRLGPLVGSIQQRLPQITQLVNDLDSLGHALPSLLGVGNTSTYLVLILDSSELRPTGGFIGNFGALQLTNGRMDANFHISDITLIDYCVKFGCYNGTQIIQLPAQYDWLRTIFAAGGTQSWSLRDSNLDPDYPTTARNAEQLYQKLYTNAQGNINYNAQVKNQTPFQLYNPVKSGQFAGVVTLSLGFFQQALGITGALQINDGPIHETVNQQNFVQKIHYYALAATGTGPDNQFCGDTSCAKVFTSDVVKAFMTTIKSNLSKYMGGLAKLFYDSLKTKDIEVFLTDPKSEQLLLDLRSGSQVEAPATGDSVFEVEANIGANKDNGFLKYNMSDNITLDQSGAATHKLTWTYTWPNDPNTFNESFQAGGGYGRYHSYSRIFVPPNASLISQNGLAEFGQDPASAPTFQREVFHGAAYAQDILGHSDTYQVNWKAPGVVTHDSLGYHYHLLFQREAGIVWPLTLSITLPACGKLIDPPVTNGLTTAQTYTIKGNTFTLTGPLTQDIQLQLDYTC